MPQHIDVVIQQYTIVSFRQPRIWPIPPVDKSPQQYIVIVKKRVFIERKNFTLSKHVFVGVSNSYLVKKKKKKRIKSYFIELTIFPLSKHVFVRVFASKIVLLVFFSAVKNLLLFIQNCCWSYDLDITQNDLKLPMSDREKIS